MIADDRRSLIANVLRLSAIIWKHTSAVVCNPKIMITNQLQSCNHMETNVFQSTIEIYPM